MPELMEKPLDAGGPDEAQRELGYASGESPKAPRTSGYPLESVARRRLCRLCGRIEPHAAPGDRP